MNLEKCKSRLKKLEAENTTVKVVHQRFDPITEKEQHDEFEKACLEKGYIIFPFHAKEYLD